MATANRVNEEIGSSQLQQRDGNHKDQSSFTNPPEWGDRDRMHFLLAPFPLNQAASPSQDPKLLFWSSLIISSSREIKKPTFTDLELQARFKWNQTLVPSCLGTVIQSMEKSGMVLKISDYLASSKTVGWVTWGARMVSKPVRWVLSGYLPNGKYNGEYVLTALIKEYAANVLKELLKTVQYKSTDMVMREEDFVNISQKVVNTEILRLVEISLAEENKIQKQPTEMGYCVVKFAPSEDDLSAVPISEVDVGIVRIKETLKCLANQVESLTLKVERLKQLAKEKLTLNNKQAALRLLRQSKSVRNSLEKREMALDNLQATLHQIQMAETDVMIFQAYRSGVSALKSLRESQGLTLEAAEDAVAELREAVDENEEIAGVLGDGLGGESDEDLERELAAMLEPQEVDLPSETRLSAAIERDLEAQLASLTLENRNVSSRDEKEMPKTKTEMPQVKSHHKKPSLLV